MSNEMNKERELDKQLAEAYKAETNEETSSELDASIMAMAQQEVDSREKGKQNQSWWHRLRLPVSLTAALVVTVGIARLMVELGYYDPNTALQDNGLPPAEYVSTVTLEESPQPAMAAPAPRKAPPESVSRDRAALEQREAEIESIRETAKMIEQEELLRSQKMKAEELAQAKKVEQEQVADALAERQQSMLTENKASRQAEPSSEQAERIVVVGSRIKRSDSEEGPTTIEDKATQEDDVNSIAKETNLASGDSVAIDTPYLPANEWIESIEELLEQENKELAKQEWLKFKQVYPDVEVAEELQKRLNAL